jgi:hypothetical protein
MQAAWAGLWTLEQDSGVCVYYCRTYYKDVRVGGGVSGWEAKT